jgi:hypothetical protein
MATKSEVSGYQQRNQGQQKSGRRRPPNMFCLRPIRLPGEEKRDRVFYRNLVASKDFPHLKYNPISAMCKTAGQFYKMITGKT